MNLTSAVLEDHIDKDKNIYAKNVIRTDSTIQKIDKFLANKSENEQNPEEISAKSSFPK